MLRSLLVLLLLPALLAAAVPTTNVTGSLNLPSGASPTNVSITLTPSQAFSVSDASGIKYQVTTVPQVFAISNAAVVSINVIPNTGSSNSPNLTTYRVKIKAGTYTDETMTWQVPTNSLGVNLADLPVSAPVAAAYSYLQLIGGVMQGKLTLASTSTLPGLRWPVTTEPVGAAAGDTYINATDFLLYIYNGSAWQSIISGLSAVTHYSDLTGSGTGASPLRITPGAADSVMFTNTAGTSPTFIAVTGDVTFASGVSAIGAGKVVLAQIATAVKSPIQTLDGTRKITTTAALANGSASAGTGIDAAAGDHVHPLSAGSVSVNVTGTAYAATALHLNGGQPAGTPSGNVSPTASLIGTTLNVTLTAPEDNLWINPDMEVAQRGTSFAAIASGAYSLDRLKYLSAGAVVHTITQSSTAPTVAQAGRLINTSAKLDVTTVDSSIAAGDYCIVGQPIEGWRWKRAAQGAFTLSFWARDTKTGTHCVSFRNSGTDRSYVAEYTIFTADTLEWKTITVPWSPSAGTWDYTTGIGIHVYFALSCGSTFQTTANAWQTGNYLGTSNQVNATDSTSNDFYVTGVLLTPGYSSPLFRARGYGVELALCQRYYEQWGDGVAANAYYGTGQAISTTRAILTFPYNTVKRVAPTITVSSATHFTVFTAAAALQDVTAFAINDASTRAAGMDFTVAGGLVAGDCTQALGDAGGNERIYIDSEL